MNLVGNAHKDEGGNDKINHGISGHKHEHAVCVRRQPDVVLGNEQLKQSQCTPVIVDHIVTIT